MSEPHDASRLGNKDRESFDTVELRLFVHEADLDRFEPLLRRLAILGIQFRSLAEEQRSQSDWLSGFCDLDNCTRNDDPEVPRTVEHMRDRLAWLEFTPESCILANLREHYVRLHVFGSHSQRSRGTRSGLDRCAARVPPSGHRHRAQGAGHLAGATPRVR
jgi:hypothetical protein